MSTPATTPRASSRPTAASDERDPEPVALTQYIQQLLDEVRAVPGVQDTAVATAIPLRGWGDGMPFRMPDKPDEIVGTGFKIVTPGYFRTLGLRLVSGRLLDERDTGFGAGRGRQRVVRAPIPAEQGSDRQPDPGRADPRAAVGPRTAWEIVGVVVDEKASGLENPTDVGAYASFAQSPVVGLGLVARGIGDPAMLIKSLQGAVRRVNKCQVLDRPMPVTQLKADSTIGRRLPTYLLGGFALLAMLLACAGIYGVLSFVTAKRTQELGSAPRSARRRGPRAHVIRSGTMPVIAGIVLGLGGAMWLSRFMQAMLFQVSRSTPRASSPSPRSSSPLRWPRASCPRGARRASIR